METILIIFIILKLTGVIVWPWLWVLSPLWLVILIPFSLFLGIGFLVVLNKYLPNNKFIQGILDSI